MLIWFVGFGYSFSCFLLPLVEFVVREEVRASGWLLPALMAELAYICCCCLLSALQSNSGLDLCLRACCAQARPVRVLEWTLCVACEFGLMMQQLGVHAHLLHVS